MPSPPRLIVFVAVTFALAGATEARVHKPIHRHGLSHHRVARARSRHQILEMSDADVTTEKARYAPTPIQQDGRLRTSLEHRFGRTGVVGALGYNHAADGPHLDPHAVNSAASTQLGRPDNTLGAKVSIPF
jgi:hypothetical protein